jgi:hypothetical protein
VDQRAEYRLPAAGQARHLGQGLACLRTPDVASYPELVDQVISSVGWRADGLDAFRVVTRYPVLHSSTLLSIPAAGVAGD